MGSKWGLAFRDAARALAARRHREEGEEEAALDEAGFTLIELMVVLLIMGILMAIAIPTFLGAANGAHDKASQSDLTNAMTSAKSIYAANGSYTATTAAKTALKKAEPEMTFTGTTGTHATHISVAVLTTHNVLLLASYSGTTKNCWVAADNENGTTTTATVDGAVLPAGISYGLVKTVAAKTACHADTITLTTVTGALWHRAYKT